MVVYCVAICSTLEKEERKSQEVAGWTYRAGLRLPHNNNDEHMANTSDAGHWENHHHPTTHIMKFFGKTRLRWR